MYPELSLDRLLAAVFEAAGKGRLLQESTRAMVAARAEGPVEDEAQSERPSVKGGQKQGTPLMGDGTGHHTGRYIKNGYM